MKRVGSYSRKENRVRLIEIWNSIGKHQAIKGFATITDIANDLKMKPSTHLKNLVFKLYHSDKIDMEEYQYGENRISYHFYFSEQKLDRLEQSCDMPWICARSKNDIVNGQCRKETDDGIVICPVFANINKQNDIVQSEENMIYNSATQQYEDA